jgi:phosphoribosylaminoimidazole (AIR) synthetase
MQDNSFPTRTYAPIIKKILDKYTAKEVHGMVHCSGGALKRRTKNIIKKMINFLFTVGGP